MSLTISIVTAILQKSEAVTLDEFQATSNNIQNVCLNYNRYCKVNFVDKDTYRAFSTSNEIYVYKALINILDKDELFAVLLHEAGHIILNHHKKYFSFMWNNYPITYNNRKILNHSQEFEADLFATYYQLNNKKLNYLPSALKKIMPAGYENYETVTHPSYAKRIINMTTNRSLTIYEM